jgi:hypothetical protein
VSGSSYDACRSTKLHKCGRNLVLGKKEYYLCSLFFIEIMKACVLYYFLFHLPDF